MSEDTNTDQDIGQQEVVAGLQLNDIAACLQVIDICSKRGAFEGTELEAVGKLRGKLATFVRAAAPQPEEQTEEPPVEDSVAVDDDGPAVELG